MFGEGRHAGKYYGKYSGEVQAIDADANFMGTIQVTVPAIFGNGVLVTARPCLPYAHFFVPAVGTKVWVEFEGGDTDFPIWVGTWYPQNATPVSAAVSPPENRVIETASGHTLQFLDTDGSESIKITHKLNSFVVLDKNGSVIVGSSKGSTLVLNAESGNESIVVVDQNGNALTLNDQGITLATSDGSASLMLAPDTITLAAKSIVLQGQTVALGAGASEPTILGATFATIFATHMHGTSAPGAPTTPPVPTGPPLAPAPAGQGLTSSVIVV